MDEPFTEFYLLFTIHYLPVLPGFNLIGTSE
jgi:hypothetical protein